MTGIPERKRVMPWMPHPATSARGEMVAVHVTPATRFGTPKLPFARAQLVPGAVVVARLRDEPDGTVVATVIAAAESAVATASATA